MSRPHASALVEDAWHRWLERALRRRQWRNRVIGHTGYGSNDFVRVFARVLLAREHADQAHQDDPFGGLRSPYVLHRGWRSFLTAPAMGAPIEIRVGNNVAHGRADRSGHVDVTFHRHGLPPGWHEVTISAPYADPVQAAVVIVDPDETFGIVSDVDDTVITTMLPRPMLAAWNTFVRHEGARSVVPGMAPLYRKLLEEHPGAPIVYVSTGAWNAAPTLTRFLKSHGYPRGPLLLTDWGPTNTGWFRSGRQHKKACLHRLARDFPGIRWLLIGDDGQHDPTTYQDFAEARPDQVDAVAIRQLTATEQVLSHGLPVSNEDLAGRPREPGSVPVFYAADGYGLMRILRAAGRVGSSVPQPSVGALPEERGWRA